MRIFFIFILLLIGYTTNGIAQLHISRTKNTLENIVLNLELPESFPNLSAACKLLPNILTQPKAAPWGLILAKQAECNIKPQINSLKAYEIWSLKVVELPEKSIWTIERKLNLETDKSADSQALRKIEASQVILADSELRKKLYKNERFYALIIASLLQQLPFYNYDSKLNKTQIQDVNNLPYWEQSLETVTVCLTENWKVFSINPKYLGTRFKNNCSAKQSWLIANINRGSMNRKMNELVLAEIDLEKSKFEANKEPKKIMDKIFPNNLGLNTSIGISKYSVNYNNINMKKNNFAGFNLAVEGKVYYIPNFISFATILVPITIGTSWYYALAPAEIQKTNESSYLVHSGGFFRSGTGLNVIFSTKYKVISEFFYDFGLFGYYGTTPKTNNTIKYYNSSKQYGFDIGGKYLFNFGLTIGLTANWIFGEFVIQNSDKLSKFSKANYTALGGNLNFGWDLFQNNSGN